MKKYLILLTISCTIMASCAKTDNAPDDEDNPPGGSGAQVWMSYKWNPSKNAYDHYQFVIFPNKDCLDYLPEPGLLNFSKASYATTNWGKAVDKGNELHLEFGNGTVRKLGKLSATKMAYPPGSDATFYYKCRPVNGLRIEGAYTPDPQLYEQMQNTPAASITPGSGKDIIFFKKDGTYFNEGISYANITYGDASVLGNGTYEIKDYSIVLTTSSGKKWQLSFTGINDFEPFADQSGFMINHLLNYKLGK